MSIKSDCVVMWVIFRLLLILFIWSPSGQL